jgi:hypothetical protein
MLTGRSTAEPVAFVNLWIGWNRSRIAEVFVMYAPTFGGSGLLHLLVAHPRVVAIFGVAATSAR